MPRGDAEKLKADTEDGWTGIANLLLEAMIAAPLTGIELKIMLFVIRRTYGWAKKNNPNSGKAAVMTAAEIARGMCVSPRTVERPLTGLTRNGLLLRLETEPGKLGVPLAYGINTHVDDWGSGPDWSLFRTQMREAKQDEVYTLNSVVPLRRIAYRQYAAERIADTLQSVSGQALKPTAAAADEPLHLVVTPKERTALPEPAADGDSGSTEHEQKTPREDTPQQSAANACLAVWGLTHNDLSREQAGRYYGAITKLIGDLEHGADELLAWAEGEQTMGGHKLGAGAKPERAIPAAVRKAVTASGWQKAFAGTREATRGNGQRFILRPDGVKVFERDWSWDDRSWVDACTAAGTWLTEQGISNDYELRDGKPVLRGAK